MSHPYMLPGILFFSFNGASRSVNRPDLHRIHGSTDFENSGSGMAVDCLSPITVISISFYGICRCSFSLHLFSSGVNKWGAFIKVFDKDSCLPPLSGGRHNLQIVGDTYVLVSTLMLTTYKVVTFFPTVPLKYMRHVGSWRELAKL